MNKKGTRLTAYSPAGSAGTVDIIVTTLGGPSSPSAADHFTYEGPVITSLSPASGPTTGGTTVKISGADLGGATAVDFGSTPATSFTVTPNGTTITAVCPRPCGRNRGHHRHHAGAVPPRPARRGSSATTPRRSPAVAPSGGPSTGGTRVTIDGTDLAGATSVAFGSVPATSFTVNPKGTEIKAIAPAHAGGSVNIVVTTPGGASTVTAPTSSTTAEPTTAERFRPPPTYP